MDSYQAISHLLLLVTFFSIVKLYAAETASPYTVTRNVAASSLQNLSPYALQVRPSDAHCTTKCTMDDLCTSAIFDKETKNCLLFTDSQASSISTVPDDKTVSYFEKVDCDWTEVTTEDCCYTENLSCLDQTSFAIYQDCQDAFENGERDSGGIFYLKPFTTWRVIRAVCQFDTTSGWTVIQRQLDGSVDFYRYWNDYVHGFGNLNGEYWIGLEAIYYLTRTNQKLSIFLEAWEGETRTANYSTFYIDGIAQKYVNHISGYSGDAGDSWSSGGHVGQRFTTRDNDNDNDGNNCAQRFTGAWWYDDCHHANLNGQWYDGEDYTNFATGTSWYSWKGHYYSFKTIYMRLSR